MVDMSTNLDAVAANFHQDLVTEAREKDPSVTLAFRSGHAKSTVQYATYAYKGHVLAPNGETVDYVIDWVTAGTERFLIITELAAAPTTGPVEYKDNVLLKKDRPVDYQGVVCQVVATLLRLPPLA